MTIEIVSGDITTEETDAIVNAANDGLYRGSGVCGAIHAAAGSQLQLECMLIAPMEGGDNSGWEGEVRSAARELLMEIYQAVRDQDRGDEDPIQILQMELAKRYPRGQIREVLEAALSAIAADDGAYFKAGGRSITRVDTGGAAITSGASLPAGHVVHAVGPIWNGGLETEEGTYPTVEENQLYDAYRNSVSVAAQVGCRSISFPSISTGIYGFPLELAAPIAICALGDAILEYPQMKTVRLVAFDAKTEDALRAAADGYAAAGGTAERG